jgi:E3 ubiquitin-protein ligase MARCH6
MNDPQYATNTGGGEDGTSDADTCRICRGEATELEPLFYPCKCSGSIKFVHQDCLMEWLSHSQKKHCELCKTPFRFTKLYAPNMPQTLPAYVFARHLVIHALKNMAIWLRFCLVVFVWLGCLPWAMRHIWGFLFWFGDGGWTSKDLDSPSYDVPTQQVLEFAHEKLAHLIENGTSPASPWLTRPTTPARFGVMMSMLPTLLKPFAQTLNMSASDSVTSSFFKSIMHSLGLHGTPSTGTFNITNTTQILAGNQPTMAGRSSLLGDVHFLRTLTRHPQINSIIVTTLEGQIITIVVVICFILVFLIREWVVQQQPGINMGAGFNADLAGADRLARNRDLQIDNQPDAERVPVDRFPVDIIDLQDAGGGRGGEVAGRPVARPIARPRRRIVIFEDGQGNNPEQANEDERLQENTSSTTGQFREEIGEGSSDNSQGQRQSTPVRDVSSAAVQIQQHMASDDSSEMRDKSDAAEFVSLWRRAGGDPEEVLRIIEAEGLGEKLRYWKNVTKGLQHPNLALTSPPNDHPSSSGAGSLYGSSGSLTIQPDEGTHLNNDSWIHIPQQANVRYPLSNGPFHIEHSNSEASSSRKGKEKPTPLASETSLDSTRPSLSRIDVLGPRQESTEEDLPWRITTSSQDTVSFHYGPGRPRSISDGPKLQENISPLASNNWSFHDLPNPTPAAKTSDATLNSEEQSWKAAQDIRVQQAFANGRATQTASQAGSSSKGALSMETPDTDPQDSTGPIEIYNIETRTTQHYQSWDEAFANNPLSDSEDDFEETAAQDDGPEQNGFHQEGVLPGNGPLIGAREPIPAPRPTGARCGLAVGGYEYTPRGPCR